MEYKGYTIKVEQDEHPLNPREEFDYFTGKMICFHGRYTIGDKHDLSSSDFTSWEMLKGYLEKNNDIAVILPIYMYDHSGITIRTTPYSCRWDSGQIGWIYATKEKVRENFMVKRITKSVLEKVEKCLVSEIEEYDNYLTGNIWGYIIEDEEGEEVESCWGFIGDKEYCETEAKSIVDNIVKEHGEQLKLDLV